jgi:hypothetical protein
VSAGEDLQRVYDAYIRVANELYFETRELDYARRSFLAAEQNRAAALRRATGASASLGEEFPDRYWNALN